MEAALLAVWSAGLLLAFGMTLVVLKQVFLVVGALQDILRLAEITRDAARGIGRNLAIAEDLERLGAPAGALRHAAGALASSAAALEQRLVRLAPEARR